MRPHVRQFINLLGRLAIEIDGAVVLCMHPSVNGLSKKDGTGGSTAWNNTVRSRIFLNYITKTDGEEFTEEDAKNLRQLTKMKANYSTRGDKIILRYKTGAFHVESSPVMDMIDRIERGNRDKNDENVFLHLLDKFIDQGRVLSDSKNSGSTYAPKVMATTDRGREIKAKRFAEAMARLFEANVIDRGYVGMGADRKKREGIRRKPT